MTEDSAGGGHQGIDWQACLHAVRERLWIVILCLVLGGMAAAAFLLNQRQQYQSRSVLFIEREQSRVLDKVQGVGQEQILSLDMINTVVDLIRSYPFAQRVAARLTLCQQRFKTLLIDADLRRPMVSRVFFNANRQPGLSEVLLGKVEFADAVIPTEMPDLSILSAGGRVANPAEILATARMREVLAEALLTHDRVVVDTAPALAVSDSLLLAPHVDVTCLVLRSFKTPRKTFARALKALADINCQPVGVVLNFLPSGMGTYYYYSGRYYGSYGEKGVYGT